MWDSSVLPLITDAREERDGERSRYANLLPFLRNVGDVRVEHSDGTSLDLQTTSRRILRTTDGYQIDHVEISGATHAARRNTIRLLRVRHDGHEGQLGLLLGGDNLPVVWSDVFDSDIVQARASGLGQSSSRAPATATRAFLRFLATRGVVPASIEGAVPTIREWKHATLPRALTDDDVLRVLAAVDDTCSTSTTFAAWR